MGEQQLDECQRAIDGGAECWRSHEHPGGPASSLEFYLGFLTAQCFSQKIKVTPHICADREVEGAPGLDALAKRESGDRL